VKIEFKIQPFLVTIFTNPTYKSVFYPLNVIKVQWEYVILTKFVKDLKTYFMLCPICF